MVRAMPGMVSIVACLLAAGFFGGFAGALHPLGDSLAVFRIPIAVVFALWVIWSPWPAFVRWLTAVLCLAAMGQIVAQKYVSRTHRVRITIYQKTCASRTIRLQRLPMISSAANPDIVALQELTSRNAPLVRDLRAEFPYQASCALVDWARVAILSRWPIEGEVCVRGQGFVGIQVASPEGPFWAFSLHAFWPWPHGQAAQFDRLEPILAELRRPCCPCGGFQHGASVVCTWTTGQQHRHHARRSAVFDPEQTGRAAAD